MAETNSLPPAYRGDHQPKPLTFDPTKLRGLSERLLRSHPEHADLMVLGAAGDAFKRLIWGSAVAAIVAIIGVVVATLRLHIRKRATAPSSATC